MNPKFKFLLYLALSTAAMHLAARLSGWTVDVIGLPLSILMAIGFSVLLYWIFDGSKVEQQFHQYLRERRMQEADAHERAVHGELI